MRAHTVAATVAQIRLHDAPPALKPNNASNFLHGASPTSTALLVVSEPHSCMHTSTLHNRAVQRRADTMPTRACTAPECTSLHVPERHDRCPNDPATG
jgi:hypothetical protein